FTQDQNGILTGIVKDPNNAVVPKTQVSVRNETTGEARETTTDGQGQFKLESLAPGTYKVSLKRDGFKNAERSVAIEPGKTASIEVKFEIAEARAEVTVNTKATITSNANPDYRALRDGDLAETYEITGMTLKRDVGNIKLNSGRISFSPPV